MENIYLEFTHTFFAKIGIPTHITEISAPAPDDLDMGLRKMLFSESFIDMVELAELKEDQSELPAICFSEDIYTCHYVVIPIPGQEIPVLFVAGPYLTEVPGVLKTQDLCRRLGIPQQMVSSVNQYFSSLPCVDNQVFLESYMEALGEVLFGIGNCRIKYTRQLDRHSAQTYSSGEFSESNENMMNMLERRYLMEEQVMDAISRGDYDKSARLISDLVFSGIDNRASSTLRSRKNILFVFNTICRKAAERAEVHPIHLDEISRRMAIQIENMVSQSEYKNMQLEILKNYCSIVRRYSTKGYSPIMQKALNHISGNLDSTNLTLSSTSDALSLNKSYLATLFKKETGETFTEYVNKKRIDHAAFLLKTSGAGIQTIASACGIPDTTYFTRLFRRHKGMTPSQYRASK